MDVDFGNGNEFMNYQLQRYMTEPPTSRRSNVSRPQRFGPRKFNRFVRQRGSVPSTRSSRSRPDTASTSAKTITTSSEPRPKDAPQPKASIMAYPILTLFPIWCSNLGISTICQWVFDTLRARDYRMAAVVSELQMEYVTCIAFISRILQVNVLTGARTGIPEISRVKDAAAGIHLPKIIVDYISALGKLDLAQGQTVIPLAGTYRQMFPLQSPLIRDPATILEEAGRNIPPGEWPLDNDWISEWNRHTTRPSQAGMKFMPIDNSQIDGRIEMVTTYRTSRPYRNLLTPFGPQVCTEAELQLGASYRFRDERQRAQWFGENKRLLHSTITARDFDPQVLISDLTRASFTSP